MLNSTYIGECIEHYAVGAANYTSNGISQFYSLGSQGYAYVGGGLTILRDYGVLLPASLVNQCWSAFSSTNGYLNSAKGLTEVIGTIRNFSQTTMDVAFNHLIYSKDNYITVTAGILGCLYLANRLQHSSLYYLYLHENDDLNFFSKVKAALSISLQFAAISTCALSSFIPLYPCSAINAFSTFALAIPAYNYLIKSFEKDVYSYFRRDDGLNFIGLEIADTCIPKSPKPLLQIIPLEIITGMLESVKHHASNALSKMEYFDIG